MYQILFVFLGLLSLTPGLQTKQQFRSEEFRVVYEWYKLDFTWPDESAKRSAFLSRRFVPQNNIISGIKIWMHKVFLTLPRWKEGVPATLVTVPSIPIGPSASPRLEPFPSWEWQDINNCSALQNVHAVEIDLDGILWVVDSGTTNELEYADFSCPPKLLQFNAETREHYYTYTFPPGTVNKDSILFDIVIDPKTRTAYISDSSETQPGIIVYREGVSYKVTGGISMQSDPSIGSIVVNGTEIRRQQNIGPLALSVVERVLYFSPVTSHHLYSVHLSALDRPGDISSSIRDLGRKLNSSSGMILDSKHVLYYGLLESNGIARWDSSRDPFSTGQRIITEDAALLQWPCAFAFDQQRALWVISNRFQTFLANTINLEVPNFRLIKAYTGTQSYLYANEPQSLSVSSSNDLYANRILLLLSISLSAKLLSMSV